MTTTTTLALIAGLETEKQRIWRDITGCGNEARRTEARARLAEISNELDKLWDARRREKVGQGYEEYSGRSATSGVISGHLARSRRRMGIQ